MDKLIYHETWQEDTDFTADGVNLKDSKEKQEVLYPYPTIVTVNGAEFDRSLYACSTWGYNERLRVVDEAINKMRNT